MLATIMPFACMGVGLLVGFQSLPEKFYKVVDWVTTISLMILMVTIGGNVGTSEDVIANLGTVGLNCLITCLCAIAGSVGLCFLVEKTILPLEKYSEMQIDDKSENAVHSDTDKKKTDPILILIPVCVIGGALGCYLFMPQEKVFLLDYSLWSSLVVLYTSVGIGMGQNKAVFGYMKKVGFKVIYLVLGVYLGSILGGAVSAWITGMPLNYALISASGAGYYSMTGATMLSVFGAEAGVYGFMVNVFRDFFTILLLPIFARISKSAPVASGGAGNMDTMLVPITRAVGRELGLIALIVGVAITFGVPVMLPILCNIFA
ncbi:MAG: lysine exporter LysO family protein [Emergencia sp.]